MEEGNRDWEERDNGGETVVKIYYMREEKINKTYKK